MTNLSLTNKYFIKNTAAGTFSDVATAYDGVRIVETSSLSKLGKSVNVFTAQWLNTQTEDFFITASDMGATNIIRENIDFTITFVVSQRYVNGNTPIDVSAQADAFIAYMTDTDIWFASTYEGKQVHCVALQNAEPKTVKLHRGKDSFIVGEITLHTLEKPTVYPTPTPTQS